MSKRPSHHNEDWTPGQIRQLRKLAKEGRSTAEIARRLGRTLAAVRAKASEKRISLKPRDR